MSFFDLLACGASKISIFSGIFKGKGEETQKPTPKPPSMFNGLDIKDAAPKPFPGQEGGFSLSMPEDATSNIFNKNSNNQTSIFTHQKSAKLSKGPKAPIVVKKDARSKIIKKDYDPFADLEIKPIENTPKPKNSEKESISERIKKNKPLSTMFEEIKSDSNIDAHKIEENTPEKPKLEIKHQSEEPKSENRITKLVEEKRKKEQLEKKLKAEEEKYKLEQEKREKELYENPDSLKESIKLKNTSFNVEFKEKTKEQEIIYSEQSNLNKEILEDKEKVKELEIFEEKSAETEEFEKAAQYHREIEILTQQIKQKEEKIQENRNKFNKLDMDKSEIYSKQLKWLNDTCNKNEYYNSEFEKSIQSLKEYNEGLRKDLNEKIENSHKEIEDKEVELQEQDQIAKENWKQLQEKIELKTQSVKEDKEKLTSELKELETEIEDLLKIITEKKAAAKKLKNEIKDLDAKLTEELQEFNEELSISMEEKKFIETETENLLIKKENLKSEQESLQKEVELTQSKIEMHTNHIEALKALKSFLETEKQIIQNSIKEREETLQKISEYEGIVKDKENGFNEAQNAYNKKIAEIEEIVKAISVEEEKLKDLGAKIPALEIEKKNAVSTKNFTEAAKIANEIKDLISEQANKKNDIDMLKEELVEQKTQLLEDEKLLEQLRDDLIKEQIVLDSAKESLLHAVAHTKVSFD